MQKKNVKSNKIKTKKIEIKMMKGVRISSSPYQLLKHGFLLLSVK